MSLLCRSSRLAQHVLMLLILEVLQANAQIRIEAPEYLVNRFKETDGRIQGATSTFGAPFYGDRVLGRLVYGPSTKGHSWCTEDDYEVPGVDKMTKPGAGYEEARLINIILVRRGGECAITQKVRVARAKGAHAVIVVDKADSPLTSQKMAHAIVRNDGSADNVHIPSVLIAKEDGLELIDAAKTHTVVVELAWNVPSNKAVDMQFWMSSASQESMTFLRQFAPRRRALNKLMNFQPHFTVFGIEDGEFATKQNLCWDSTGPDAGKWCAEDPDGPGALTGKDVLQEDVRQLCIHEVYKVEAPIKIFTLKIYWSPQYWEYVEKFGDACPLDKFGTECSEGLMAQLNIDKEKVQSCMETSYREKLMAEERHKAWSPRAVQINGWRYSGILDAELVTHAVCAGFTDSPPDCAALLKPRDPFQPFESTNDGISMSTLTILEVGLMLLIIAAGMLYARSLKKELRTSVREEVMLEVQAQYSRMG
mmetsp:Transcript_68607/g.135717  ORF Transcript_68607/g.135717 Transcript_68607/m.135717 type:complete len:479 (-) Transcript_68607:65-1501(-)